MRLLFAIILFLHLFIHLIGFAKANHWLGGVQENSIPGTQGFLWLLVSVVLLVTAIYFLLHKPVWIILALPVVIISQTLIILNWEEAKFGSIFNFIILVVAIVSIAGWKFENSYREDKVKAILSNPGTQSFLSQKDIEHLPKVIQNYISLSGAIGKPRIDNILIKFVGEMREYDEKWFKFRSEQFNTIKSPRRYFFMKAIFKGIPTKGYHRFDGRSAKMTIKPLSLIKVVNLQSKELLISEMVTYLNDICLFAPGALIDKKFSWEETGPKTVKVTFSNEGHSVSAILEFDEEGRLINFFSNDRYDVNKKKKFMFSTPVGGYTHFDGYRLAGYGEAVWHYPEEEFVYGKFEVKQVKYNISS